VSPDQDWWKLEQLGSFLVRCRLGSLWAMKSAVARETGDGLVD